MGENGLEGAKMASSVMVWLVNPGEYPHEEREEEWASAGRNEAPGAATTGSNVGHALPWMRYVVYEPQEEAEGALEEISDHLQQNRPLRISSQASRVWLLPADRVHYVICEGVIRPKDR